MLPLDVLMVFGRPAESLRMMRATGSTRSGTGTAQAGRRFRANGIAVRCDPVAPVDDPGFLDVPMPVKGLETTAKGRSVGSETSGRMRNSCRYGSRVLRGKNILLLDIGGSALGPSFGRCAP
mgnify:CR=1 FL=1